MAVIDIRINAQNDASRQLLQLRANMNALNRTLAEQRVALSRATGEERENIQGKVNATRALQAQNRLEQQTLTLKKQFIAQGQREQRQQEQLERQHERLNKSTDTSRRSYGRWTDQLANSAIIYSQIGYHVSNLVRSTIRVGAETERYQAVLRATEPNAAGVLQQLQQLNRELIGTDFATINRTFLSLRAAGTGLEDTLTTVTGLSRALGQLQVDAYDQQRFFTQLTQSYAQNRLELDEFKILQETLPNILRLSSRALDTEIRSYDQLKEVLEASNQSARDYYRTLASFSAQNISGIDTSTYTAQVELLRESVREVQREISQTLIPILAAGAGQARDFISIFGSVSRGDIAAYVTSLLGVTAAVKGLTTVYAQWQLASQLVNSTTIATGANAARLTVTLQGLSLGLRTMTTNLAANLAAWNAAGIGMGAFLGIAAAVTAAVSYFSVRAAVAREEVDAFTTAMARLGEEFKNAEGGQRRFAELTETQLQRSVNTAITERERLQSEITRLVAEIARTSEIPQPDDVFLLPSLDNLPEFIQGLETVRANLAELGQDRSQFFAREQLVEVDRLLATLRPLSTQYEIISKTIGNYENRLKELQAAEAASTQSKVDQARSVGQLQVSLAQAEQQLTRTGQALRTALAGGDVDAIRSATAAQTKALEERTAFQRELLTAEAKDREQTESNTLKTKAEAIRIETALETQKASLRAQSEAAITAIVEGEVKKQTDAFVEFYENVTERQKAAADARIAEQKRVTANYIYELQQQERADEIAIEAGRRLQQRLGQRELADGLRVQFDTDEIGEALRLARELAEVGSRFNLDQLSFDRFSDEIALDQLIPSGDESRLQQVYAEYAQTFSRLNAQALRDFEDRIAQAVPVFQDRVSQDFQDAAQMQSDRAIAEFERWRQYQRGVYRQMSRDARQWSRVVTGFVDDVFISRTQTIQEALISFLQASARRIIQDAIETQILIANQRRYQAELAKTAALSAGAQSTGAAGVLGTAVSALAGGNPLIAALTSVLPQALSVFLQVGENEVRDITDMQTNLRNEGRL